MSNFYLLLSLIFLFITTTAAKSQCPGTCLPLAQESFTYPPEEPLESQVGGSGWGAPWSVQNQNSDVPGYQTTAGNLSYSDLQAFGNSGEGGHVYLGCGRYLNTDAGGPFDGFLNGNGLIGVADSTLYFSALLRKEEDNDQPAYVGLHQGNIDWLFENSRVGMGYFDTNSNSGGQRFWTLRVEDNYYLTSDTVAIDSTVLLVMRIDFGQNDQHTIHLFVNPPTIGANEPVADLVQAVNEPLGFGAVVFYGGNIANESTIDELRISDTYQCAVPDASTNVNQLPIASFTADTLSGQVPFTVNFDASASHDPDGQIAAYEWSFGDGGVDSVVAPSYTFEHVGYLQTVLTVTDTCGSQSSTAVYIQARDANNEFPCNGSIQLTNPATPGMNDGSIAGYATLADTYRLHDGAGYDVTQNNANFSNLAGGVYQLDVTGASGCSETFPVHIFNDSTRISGWEADTCDFHIGVNLDGVPYWNTIRPFKNLKLSSNEFFSFDAAPGGPWNSGVMNEIPVDTNGYPLQIPYTTSRGATMVRCVISAHGSMPADQYVMLYDGTGTINFYGQAQIDSSSAGRIEFTMFGTGNQWFHIEQSTQGDHVRNIRIVRKEHEKNYDTDPYYPPFLEKMNQFSAIRFMDWGHTNGSELVHWSDRVSPTYHTFGDGAGVSYEMMCEVANRLQKDVWVCLPHQADDNFITQMATLFQNNLDSNLTIYVEYSNEVWNWQFSQAHWVNNNGAAHLAHPRKYAERCRKVFDIWHQVFAGDTARVKRVLGTQAVNPWLAQQAMAQLKDNFDYLSPTWYFGYDRNSACYQQMQANGASTTPQEVLDCTIQNWRSAIPAFRQIYDDARLYGKGVIEYEGGQHITSNPVTESFQQAIYDCQIDDGIKLLYQEVLDSIRRWDSELAMAFTLSSFRESIYGSWGALEFIEQDTAVQASPKWEALNENITCYSPKPVTVSLSAKIVLEGAFDPATGLMRDDLRQANLLQTTEPYAALGFTCEVSDTAAASVFSVTGNDAIVDWIFVELRDKNDSTVVRHTRSALLQRDGDVVDLDGVSPLEFYAKADNYYIAVRHRNHLGAATLNTFFLSENTTLVDFSTVPMFGTNALKDLGGGVFGLIAGDADRSGLIDLTDRNSTWGKRNVSGYSEEDLNLDGKIDAGDREMCWDNRATAEQLP